MAELPPSRARTLARTLARVIVSTIPVLLVAVLTFQGIRSHLFERYLVPSSSMEPTLHGDPVDGDLVLVDKTAFWHRAPERFELVVVRTERDPTASFLVKRVAAVGPIWLQIEQGDLFEGPFEHQLQRVSKNPVEHRDQMVPHFLVPNPRPEPDLPPTRYFVDRRGLWHADDEGIVLRAGADSIEDLAHWLRETSRRGRQTSTPADLYLPGHLSTRKAVTTSFLDHSGRRRGRDLVHPDIMLEVDWTPAADLAGAQVVLEHLGEYLSVDLSTTGSVQFRRNGQVTDSVQGPPIVAGRRSTFCFGHLDGRIFLVVDQTLVLHQAVDLPIAAVPGEGEPRTLPRLTNLLHFAVAGAGAEVRLHRVAVLHDLYHDRREAPFGPRTPPVFVEAGQLYLLGDNTFESRDSRFYGTFPVHDVVGRPWLVLAPRARLRSLL